MALAEHNEVHTNEGIFGSAAGAEIIKQAAYGTTREDPSCAIMYMDIAVTRRWLPRRIVTRNRAK